MATELAQPDGDRGVQKANGSRLTLLTSPEGRLLVAGVTLAFAYTVWLGVKLMLSPADSQFLTGMTATTLVFGRAAGLAFGYSVGLGHATVIPITMIVETVHVLVFYPLFVFSWRHLLVIKSLKNIFERIHKNAETHKVKIQRYGIIGLFAFVWFPFWMTGPVVGSVIGFLLRLPVWLNMTVVLLGTYVAILGWAFFMREVHERVASYDPYAAMALVVLLVVIVVVGHLLRRTLHETRHKP
ncbi:MAG: small multi-drug export protein [Planctomycetota bacterium]|jgi:uncharacterized membrane protein